MNFYTVASKILKQAKKARLEQAKRNDRYKDQFGSIPDDIPTPDDAYELAFNNEMKEFDDTCNLGIDLMFRFTSRMKQVTESNGERWYFITVRPPHTTTWLTFKSVCEAFCNKWQHKWIECTYVFEQKGESEESLGHGFHWHMRFATNTVNYYPSHILRDLTKHFDFVAKNCIKVETIKSLERCIEYMQGDKKSDAKKLACDMDIIWRQQNDIPAEVKYKTRQAIDV